MSIAIGNKRYRRRPMLLLALAAVLLFAACGKDGAKSDSAGKISVVTSFYPIYYFASEIGGEHAKVVNLIPAGVEPHDWSPKSKDIRLASTAQLFLYNGAGLEGWVDDFLQGLDKNSKLVTSEVSKGIALIDAEGHADEAPAGEGQASGANNAGSDHHDHGSVDPHTWVSPKSALVMAANIRDSFIQVDAAHKADYEAGYASLKERLMKLDDSYQETIAPLPHKAIVVSHQAFGYLCRDYGLEQVAIMGLSPDAEPRSQDMLRIAKFIKEHNVKYIFFEELVSSDLADALAREAHAETLVLNPLEGLTPDQKAKGDNYVTIMESNLQNLVKALQ